MTTNLMTAAQRTYIVRLVDQLDLDPAEAYRIQTRKLTKAGASDLIDELKARIEAGR